MSSGMIPAQPEKILRALGQVWTSLGEEERQQGKPTVLRACAMTLIVVTDEEDLESATATQTLTELMHAHPSRAIVLRSEKDAENGLAARVFAQCWKPFGKAQQICCEQIEISVHPDRLPDVGPTLLGIVVPDLPVVVWCRQSSVLRQSTKTLGPTALDSVLPRATKVIVDTRGSNLAESITVLAEWRKQGHVVGDLEWTRLTAWRETLATAFSEDPKILQPGVVQSARIEYAGEPLPASARYMAAWLKRGFPIEPSFVHGSESGVGITRVTLSGADVLVDLTRTGPVCLKLQTRDQQRRVSLAGSSFYELMHEELTILGPDPIFDSAFHHVSASMAGEGKAH